MLRIREIFVATIALCCATAISVPAQVNGLRATHLPSPSPSPVKATVVATSHIVESVKITVSLYPAIPAAGVPLTVSFHAQNTGDVAVTGSFVAAFGGKNFETGVPSMPVTIAAGAGYDGNAMTAAAPAAGSHTLSIAFYDPPLKTPNVVPAAPCDAVSVTQVGFCLQKPIGQLSQVVAVGIPSVAARFGAMTYAKIAKPDSSDNSYLHLGYQYVQHNPGCTLGRLSHGNSGSDTFFAVKGLPGLTAISSVDFVPFYPIGKTVPTETPGGFGSYGAKLEDDGGGKYTVKWNNTCELGLEGKALDYAISFRLSMPQGTDLGEQSTSLAQQPGLPSVPDGFSTIPDAAKPQPGSIKVGLVPSGAILASTFDVGGGAGTFSAIANASAVQIGLLPPGTTTCGGSYLVVLNPNQTTTSSQLAALYGSANVPYPNTIAACPLQTVPAPTQNIGLPAGSLFVSVTFAPA